MNWFESERSKLAPSVALGGMMLGAWMWSTMALGAQGDAVTKQTPKQVIGATATVTEVTSGLPFSARVDTGATTCSIHALKWEIEDPAKLPKKNVGKPIRVQIANEKGETAWIDGVIAARVRVRSSVQDEDDYHGRYKVLLPLEYNGVKKDVLVTINDRTNMEYPLLVGRNFLRGDFVVDVDVENPDIDDDEQ